MGQETEVLAFFEDDPMQVVWGPYFSIHYWRAVVTEVDQTGITWDT